MSTIHKSSEKMIKSTLATFIATASLPNTGVMYEFCIDVALGNVLRDRKD